MFSFEGTPKDDLQFKEVIDYIEKDIDKNYNEVKVFFPKIGKTASTYFINKMENNGIIYYLYETENNDLGNFYIVQKNQGSIGKINSYAY